MAGILRGQVIWADLDPTRGHEQAGHRPVVVISNEDFNADSGTVIALAITSQPQRLIYPFTLEISSVEMPRRSWVKITQVRTLSISRLGTTIGYMAQEELDLLVIGLNQLITN